MKPKFIDHIVIIIKNVKRTEKFYSRFLGKPIQQDKYQVAYKIGTVKLFFGLYYKNYKQHNKDRYGLNHLAFGVRSLKELNNFATTLSKVKIKHSGIKIDKYGKREFIWFNDPDNYRLEFYYRPTK